MSDEYRTIESTKETARKAIKILCDLNIGFQVLKPDERTNLATSFARKNRIVYGKAFDIVKCAKKIDFSKSNELEANLDHVVVYEVKSTNRRNMPDDFSGYFFDLTTAELLVAQSLDTQFKFAFVNTIKRTHLELPLSQVFSRAKKIYPKWAIRF